MMKMIKRKYLDEMISVMGTPDIKVVTGIRRSGKSVLLEEFREYVAKSVLDANVISLRLNDLEHEAEREYHRLNEYIQERYEEGRKNIVLIDEVQLCDGFELTINSLHDSGRYDIYITGSNAFLLSNDLATLFTGRTYTIEVFPFSLGEFMEYFELDDQYVALDRYMMEGGLAGAYPYQELTEKYKYVNEVYEALIVRDIQQKYSIQNIALMEELSDFLMSNVSRLTSVRKVTDTLNSKRQDVSHKTVGNYINYLCNAFAFYKVKRFDVQGRHYLASVDKYYLADHVFRLARLGRKNVDYGQLYENIVAIELMRRGYELYVGVAREKEIDFVAMKDGDKIYVQVSYDIGLEKTFSREVAPLLAIKDAYPKMVLARTRQPERNYEGIRVLDLADWLVN